MKLKQNEIAGLENCLAFGPGFIAECRGVGEFRHLSGTSASGKPYDMTSVKLQLETGDGAHVKVMEVEIQAENGETEKDFKESLKGVQRGSLVYVGIYSGFAQKPGKDGKERREQVFRTACCVPLATPAA